MTIRSSTLKLSGSELQVMSSTDITNIQQQAIHQYALDPSVTLSIVSQDGSLNRMIDRRYRAGTVSSTNTAFPANSPNIAAIDTVWDVIDQSVDSPSNTWDNSNVNIAYPVYLNSSNEIVAMSRADFYDTFIDPAIAAWYAPTGSGNFAGAGQYAIYASNSQSGFTLVNSNPVFTDSISADTIRSGNLPENPLDQPSNGTSYYLHVKNSAAQSYNLPFKIDSNGDLQQFTAANFNSLLQYHMRYAIVSRSGSQIRYQIEDQDGTQGRTSGTGVADTQYDSFSRRKQQIGDNYYTQEVPAGNIETRITYYLKIVNSGDVSGTDTSASYSASSTPTGSVDEGLTVTFILTTNNVANGTQVPYTISGITSADISAGSLSGNVEIQNGSGSTSITLVEGGGEEAETATCTFTTAAGNRTVAVDVNDIIAETAQLEGASGSDPHYSRLGVSDGSVRKGWRFLTDGTVQDYDADKNPQNNSGHQRWNNKATPTGTWYIRINLSTYQVGSGTQSGTISGQNMNLNTWYDLNTNRFFGQRDDFQADSYDDRYMTYKVEISRNNDGTNIAATGYYRIQWAGLA